MREERYREAEAAYLEVVRKGRVKSPTRGGEESFKGWSGRGQHQDCPRHHLQAFSGEPAGVGEWVKGSETQRDLATGRVRTWGCPASEPRARLRPHRFFRGSAPRTCRTAVLSSDCTETGERSHRIRPRQLWLTAPPLPQAATQRPKKPGCQRGTLVAR